MVLKKYIVEFNLKNSHFRQKMRILKTSWYQKRQKEPYELFNIHLVAENQNNQRGDPLAKSTTYEKRLTVLKKNQ